MTGDGAGAGGGGGDGDGDEEDDGDGEEEDDGDGEEEEEEEEEEEWEIFKETFKLLCFPSPSFLLLVIFPPLSSFPSPPNTPTRNRAR